MNDTSHMSWEVQRIIYNRNLYYPDDTIMLSESYETYLIPAFRKDGSREKENFQNGYVLKNIDLDCDLKSKPYPANKSFFVYKVNYIKIYKEGKEQDIKSLEKELGVNYNSVGSFVSYTNFLYKRLSDSYYEAYNKKQ